MNKNILSTKFFILLSTLSIKEKKELIDLSTCRSFNKSTRIQELIIIVIEKDIIYKNELYLNLFINEKYDDRKLRNLFSRAYLLIQKFIAFQYFERNESKYQSLFIDAFKEKKLSSLIKYKIDKWGELLSKQEILEDDFFEQKLKFNDIKFHYNLKSLSSAQRNFDISNKPFNQSLDEAFLLKKMKLFISSFNYQSLVNTVEEFTMLDEIILFIESKNDWSMMIQVYYHLLMLHYKPELEIHYEKLKSFYEKINLKIGAEQKREIFLLIQNFTIKKINQRESLYLKEFFLLFKIMLANETIYEQNILSPFSYKNIVTATLRLNETEWCINFIEKYKNKLDIKIRKDTYSLVKAKYYFFIKEYEVALLAINKTKFDDALSLINAKIITIKIYYELDEYDMLITAVDTLDKILQRKKILSKQYITKFKKFNKYLKKINGVNGKTAILNLHNKIKTDKLIDSKNWLLKKLEQKKPHLFSK